jgi:hypothetical protein
MAKFNEFKNEQRMPDGTLIVSGTQRLEIPSGGPVVRQTNVSLPFFVETPAISVTVHALDEPPLVTRLFASDRETFVIYDITFREEQTYLLCKISATNIWNAVSSTREYFCNYVVQGRERVA